MEKLFYFDLETTGVKYWKNGIHQLAFQIEIDGEIKESLDLKVRPNPKAEIEKEALDVGNVTLETVMSYPPMEDVYLQLVGVLQKYVNKFDKKDKFHLVGYNNRGFDDNFLRAFFVQNGDNYFGSWFWADSLDTLVLASNHFRKQRSELPNFQLMTVAEFAGVKIEKEKAHDALYDIQITRELFKIVS